MGKEKIFGLCNLCLQEKELCRAHIISDFLYKGLFNEKNQIIRANLTEIKQMGKPIYDGEYDTGILCNHCDNKILGNYETYASKVYDGNANLNVTTYRGSDVFSKVYELSNLDYKIFKLFLLSNLWRASISNRQMWLRASLGQKHSEKIRNALFNGAIFNENEYAVCIIGVIPQINRASKLISPILPWKINGMTGFVILINQFLYAFNVSSHRTLDIIKEFNLKENGEILIPILKGKGATNLIGDLLNWSKGKKSSNSSLWLEARKT